MQERPFYNNSIFWIEVDKIKPNPFQPRKEFDQEKLNSLADSIRQYGVLQPIVLSRREVTREDGGIATEYELIAGERRWRASKVAGLIQIPAVIRGQEETDRAKLELAIIENLQREDLNPVDRAKAFERLAKEFNFKHSDIALRVGKSREYVSNTLRLLALPEFVLEGLGDRKISEGHARSLLMLSDKPEELETLFKEIIHRKLSVREVEQISRRIAREKIRKKEDINPEIIELERELTENFGTRVQIQPKQEGGKVVIEYFSPEDFRNVLERLQQKHQETQEQSENTPPDETETPDETYADSIGDEDQATAEEDLYSIKNFSL